MDYPSFGIGRFGYTPFGALTSPRDLIPNYHIEVRGLGGDVLYAMPRRLLDGSLYEEVANAAGALTMVLSPIDPICAEIQYNREVWLFRKGKLIFTYIVRGLIQQRGV